MSASQPREPEGGNVGRGVERLEDVRLLRGAGCFFDGVRLPDMLHAAVLRSAVAHGRIVAIDVSRACAMPGVQVVIDAAAIRSVRGSPVPAIPLRQEPLPERVPFHQPVMAERKVRCAGERARARRGRNAGAGRGCARSDRCRDRSARACSGSSASRIERSPAVRGSRNESRTCTVRGDCDAVFAAASPRFRSRRFACWPTASDLRWNASTSSSGMSAVRSACTASSIPRTSLFRSRHACSVGCCIEGGASGPGKNAQLRLNGDGSIDVSVGSSGVGQGLETVHAQIAADALGLPLASIRSVAHGSTTVVKQGYGSFSSRSTVMGRSAILDAAARMRLSIREAAAHRFGCAADEVEIFGMVEVRGPGRRRASIAELATGPFIADGSFESTKRTYSYGAHAAVDPGTGQVTVIDYVAVEDADRIVNPHTLHGQTIGAIVQGLGGVLLEALHYDEASQLLTGSLADYMLPTSTEFPHIRVVALEDHPSPRNPLGATGAGEGGIIPVGGLIANAVASALRSTGVNPRSLPLTPPRVWQLLRARARWHRSGKHPSTVRSSKDDA